MPRRDAPGQAKVDRDLHGIQFDYEIRPVFLPETIRNQWQRLPQKQSGGADSSEGTRW